MPSVGRSSFLPCENVTEPISGWDVSMPSVGRSSFLHIETYADLTRVGCVNALSRAILISTLYL